MGIVRLGYGKWNRRINVKVEGNGLGTESWIGLGKVEGDVGDGSRNIYQPGERIWYSWIMEQDTGDDLVKKYYLVTVGESLK